MLINCKNCGKPISDMATVCPHCKQTTPIGGSQPPIIYKKLPSEKKASLLQDFSKAYPNDGNIISAKNKNAKILHLIKYIGLSICLITAIIALVFIIIEGDSYAGSTPDGLKIILYSLPFMVPVLVYSVIILPLIFKKLDYPYIKAMKRYTLWLYEKSIIGVPVYCTNPTIQYELDKINLDEDDNK